MNKKDKILITGGSGMVGKNLISELKKKGFNNLIFPLSKELNLIERKKVFQFFEKENPKYVFHLAAKVGGIKANIENPVDFLRDNLLLNTNIIDACYKFKVKKMVNLGSSCIYPKNCKQPMKEEYLLSGKLEPTNEGYALSKITSLRLCEYYNKTYGTNFISLMPPNLYGEFDKFGEKEAHVLSALLKKFHEAKIKKKEVEIWGKGTAKREFLYAGDMAKFLIVAMNKLEVGNLFENCFLNCGTGEEISIKNLARLISKIVKFEGKIVFNSDKPEGMKRKILDSSKIRDINHSFSSFISLEEGIIKSYKYYLKIRDKKE